MKTNKLQVVLLVIIVILFTIILPMTFVIFNNMQDTKADVELLKKEVADLEFERFLDHVVDSTYNFEPSYIHIPDLGGIHEMAIPVKRYVTNRQYYGFKNQP